MGRFETTVEAMRWEPGDLGQAGRMVGWLMGAGVNVGHPSGAGDTTTLALNRDDPDAPVAGPGDWVVRDGAGRFAVLTDAHFHAAGYTAAVELPVDASQVAVVCERLGHSAHLRDMPRDECTVAERVLTGLARHAAAQTTAAGR